MTKTPPSAAKTMSIGVCYYPEHWPEKGWADDAARMKDHGISLVRIGEFAWSRLEPNPGDYDLDWLGRAIDTLHSAGLKVCLGTPTATPPKWLVDAHPDILAVGLDGKTRGFGSRRHYCFSSPTYRREAARITEVVARAFGDHPAVTSWQTDNEYGCHDTVRSLSQAARAAFRVWLKDRYGDVDALNKAWGTVFWSQEYRSFDEIELPFLTVTEANPSHMLDYYRFSSHEVVAFNKIQVDIIRKFSPGRDITHNFMGAFLHFDHFDVGTDLDVATWDSYPIGFLDRSGADAATKQRYMRQGHPDCAAFHHDLYRRCGNGRFWVMEQQPGPVNWSHHNPAPLDGMVKSWGLEAFGHGAEILSPFRWRQAPFAQEQWHAGLLLPDGKPAKASGEIKQLSAEIGAIPVAIPTAKVALMFSYDASWMFEAQPQGAGWDYLYLVFAFYSGLRRMGQTIDIVAPGDNLSSYAAVFVPSLPYISDKALASLKATKAQLLIDPRTGSKTQSLQSPDTLAPGTLAELIPLRIERSESFAPFHKEKASFLGMDVAVETWLDHVSDPLDGNMPEPTVRAESGYGLLYDHNTIRYLAGVPDEAFLAALLMDTLARAGLSVGILPEDIRIADSDAGRFIVNYGPEAIDLPDGVDPSGAHRRLDAAGSVLAKR